MGARLANLAFVAFDKQDMTGPKEEILAEDVKSGAPRVSELALLDEKINERADEYLVEQQAHQARADARVEIVESSTEHAETLASSVVKHKKSEIGADEMTDLLKETFVGEKDQ